MTNIYIVTEMNISGKVPRSFRNMRVEFCWAKVLDAAFVNFTQIDTLVDPDIILFILPKKTRVYDGLPKECQKMYPGSKIGIIQEGPITLYLDWDVNDQHKFLNTLKSVDFLCVHNKADKEYISELLDIKNVFVFTTIYDETIVDDIIKTENHTKNKSVIISGNFSSWYGGRISWDLIKNYGFERIAIPHSGRVSCDEAEFFKKNGIELLPWTDWKAWMEILNTFKYGINFMPTRAAGTFSLNCAALGIPCVGFDDLDAQTNSQMATLTAKKYNIKDMKQAINNMLSLGENGMYSSLNTITRNEAKKYSISAMKEYYDSIVKNILHL